MSDPTTKALNSAVSVGTYLLQEPIVIPPDFGGVIAGVGRAPHCVAEGQYTKQPKPVTRYIVTTAGGAAFKVSGLGTTFRDLTVQGRQLWNWNSPLTGSIGFDIDWLTNIRNNAGNLTFENVSVLACGVGWRTGPNEWPGRNGGHGDLIALRNCIADRCEIVYQTRLDQSVHHVLDFLCVKGSGKYIIDAHRGGIITARHLYFGEKWEAMLRLGKPTLDNAYYDIDVRVDGSARDVVYLQETDANSPAIVKIRGFACWNATTSKTPVVQVCKDSLIDVQIDSFNPKNVVRYKSPKLLEMEGK